MTKTEPIVLARVVTRCGHNGRATSEWSYVSAPPHVRRFIAACSFSEACDELAANGYEFTVRAVPREVSVLEWYAMHQSGEPYCACGRVVSECDGSRRGCAAR